MAPGNQAQPRHTCSHRCDISQSFWRGVVEKPRAWASSTLYTDDYQRLATAGPCNEYPVASKPCGSRYLPGRYRTDDCTGAGFRADAARRRPATYRGFDDDGSGGCAI